MEIMESLGMATQPRKNHLNKSWDPWLAKLWFKYLLVTDILRLLQVMVNCLLGAKVILDDLVMGTVNFGLCLHLSKIFWLDQCHAELLTP